MASSRSNTPEQHGNEGSTSALNSNDDASLTMAASQRYGPVDAGSGFTNQVSMNETEDDDDIQNSSHLNQPVASARKRKASTKGKDRDKSRKRSRGASSSTSDSRDTAIENSSSENEAKEGNSERFVAAALLARTSEQQGPNIMHSLPVHPTFLPPRMGTVQHAPHQMHQQQQQQIQTAISSWSQLSPSMQSALLSSAAASVGPVFPGQPPHLASLLALQQATRLAAAGQFITSNPLAGQMLLQQLMGVAASGNPAIPTSIPMGPNFGAMFSPWPGLQSAAAVGLPPFALQTTNFQSMQPTPMPYPATLNSGGGLGEGAAPSPTNPAPSQPVYTAESIGPDVPEFLPAVLALPDDESKLSAYQILLRSQIEAFSATADDLSTHARGRNKPITLRQVGIRCRHCSHVALNRRKKGSAYFPFSLLGLYQAAQNMGSSHFHGESCSDMSDDLKEKFVESISCKSTVGSGKLYWAQSARKLGLVDTEHGIRFIRDLVAVVST